MVNVACSRRDSPSSEASPEASVAAGLGNDTRGLGYSGSISAIWGRGPR